MAKPRHWLQTGSRGCYLHSPLSPYLKAWAQRSDERLTHPRYRRWCNEKCCYQVTHLFFRRLCQPFIQEKYSLTCFLVHFVHELNHLLTGNFPRLNKHTLTSCILTLGELVTVFLEPSSQLTDIRLRARRTQLYLFLVRPASAAEEVYLHHAYAQRFQTFSPAWPLVLSPQSTRHHILVMPDHD